MQEHVVSCRRIPPAPPPTVYFVHPGPGKTGARMKDGGGEGGCFVEDPFLVRENEWALVGLSRLGWSRKKSCILNRGCKAEV